MLLEKKIGRKLPGKKPLVSQPDTETLGNIALNLSLSGYNLLFIAAMSTIAKPVSYTHLTLPTSDLV